MNRRVLAAGTGAAALLGAALVVPATAQSSSAELHLVNGLPDATVDVCVDGTLTADDLAAGARTGALPIFAGDRTVTVLPASAAGCGDTALAEETVSVAAEANVDVLAHYDAAGDPAVTAFGNDLSGTTAGHGRVVFRHGAVTGALDGWIDDTVVADDITNGTEGSGEATAGSHTVSVTPAGSDSLFVASEDLEVEAGTQYLRYIVGDEADGSAAVLSFDMAVGEAPATPAKGRIGGVDRFETAVLISREAFPDGAPVVYLGRHDEFPDSLAAKSLTDGPILIVPSCTEDLNDFPMVIEELERLDPQEVVALGNEAAICESVLDQAVAAAAN